jgi:hypothetical protein
MLDMALLQRPGMLAERPDGAGAVDHPVRRERLKRRSAAIGALFALRRQGRDDHDAELGRNGHGLRGVSGIPLKVHVADSRAGMELAQGLPCSLK